MEAAANKSSFMQEFGKWSCIFIVLLQSTDHSKCFTIHATFILNGRYNGHASRQLLVSIFLKDTSTCSCQESGFEPVTFWLLDDPFYLLSYSRPSFDRIVVECEDPSAASSSSPAVQLHGYLTEKTIAASDNPYQCWGVNKYGLTYIIKYKYKNKTKQNTSVHPALV